MILAGIDPGKRGAIAFIDTDKYTIDVADLPIATRDASSDNSRHTNIDGLSLYNLLVDKSPSEIFVEDVWTTPKDGRVGAFNFGWGTGTIHAACDIFGASTQLVLPTKWKAQMGLSSKKENAIAKARHLFQFTQPNQKPVDKIFLKSKDGRAEACLIVLFSALHYSGVKINKPLKLGLINASS